MISKSPPGLPNRRSRSLALTTKKRKQFTSRTSKRASKFTGTRVRSEVVPSCPCCQWPRLLGQPSFRQVPSRAFARRCCNLIRRTLTPCNAKPIVRILKLWRDAGAGRRARNLDVVPPRAATRCPAATHCRPLWISLRRASVVSGVVPIGTPFVHVVAKVVEPVRVRRIQSDRLGPFFPATRIFGEVFRRRVSPRVKRILHATSGGAFPLGFGGQSIMLRARDREPFTIRHRIQPGHCHHRLFRMVEFRIIPGQRFRATLRFQKCEILCVRRLVDGESEGIHPDSMPGFFVVAPTLAAHPEPSFWNTSHDGLDDSDPRRFRGGHYFVKLL